MNGNSDSHVDELLRLHPVLVIQKNERVKCTVTGHEMLAKADIILQHIEGKKYKRLTQGLDKAFDYSQYEPFLIKSDKKGHENQLYCVLTSTFVNKLPHYVTRHVNGRKFQRAKKKWEACENSGEKFVSPYNQKHQKKKKDCFVSSGEDVAADEDPEVDDMSDLYPEEDFASLTLDSDEGMLESHEKESRKVTKRSTTSGGKKRKTSVPKKKAIPKKRVCPTKRQSAAT